MASRSIESVGVEPGVGPGVTRSPSPTPMDRWKPMNNPLELTGRVRRLSRPVAGRVLIVGGRRDSRRLARCLRAGALGGPAGRRVRRRRATLGTRAALGRGRATGRPSPDRPGPGPRRHRPARRAGRSGAGHPRRRRRLGQPGRSGSGPGSPSSATRTSPSTGSPTTPRGPRLPPPRSTPRRPGRPAWPTGPPWERLAKRARRRRRRGGRPDRPLAPLRGRLPR